MLDDIIRTDIFASGVSPDGRDGIRGMPRSIDRCGSQPGSCRTACSPVSRVRIRCVSPASVPRSVWTLSESHSFRFGGLCTSPYTVAIEAEDEAGNRGVFTDMTVPAALFVAGTNVFSDFDATGHTDGYHVNYFVENSAASTLSAVFTNA